MARITRPPALLLQHEIARVAGHMHAAVRPLTSKAVDLLVSGWRFQAIESSKLPSEKERVTDNVNHLPPFRTNFYSPVQFNYLPHGFLFYKIIFKQQF